MFKGGVANALAKGGCMHYVSAAMTQNTPAIDIFSPYKLGPLQLPNRLVMAPMTRNRAGPGVPG